MCWEYPRLQTGHCGVLGLAARDVNDTPAEIRDKRPPIILFRSNNEFDDVDRFLDQLSHHGPSWEPVVRVTTRSVIESSPLPTRPEDPEPLPRRRHIFAVASYVRHHGSVYDPAVTFEFVNRLPEIVSLELYCGLCGDEGQGQARAEEILGRVRAEADRLGLTILPGAYEQRTLDRADELSLRYLADLRSDLRASSDRFWSSVRYQLRQRGLDPESVAIVDWSPDCWFFITQDFNVFRTEYQHVPTTDADLDRECEAFESWVDFSRIYADTVYRYTIESAHVLVAPQILDADSAGYSHDLLMIWTVEY